jgi:hypothetical protein
MGRKIDPIEREIDEIRLEMFPNHRVITSAT